MIPRPGGAPPERGRTVVVRQRDDPTAAAGARRLAADHSAEAIPAGTQPSAAPQRTSTVLCVEDSPIHLRLLTRQIEQHLHCRVLSAASVEAAVAHLLDVRPDLIMTDLMMPDLDGVDLVAILRSRPEWRDIPVVVHSVVSDVARVHPLITSGVKDYILKPFIPEAMIPRLTRLLPAGSADAPRPAPPAIPRSPDRVPVLLTGASLDLRERVAASVHPLFEVIATDPGPAAVTAAVEVHPWAALLAASAGPWDNAKTMKALLALRCVDRLRMVPVSLVAAGGEQALAAALRRELGKAPFSITPEGPQLTVSVAESFATSCTEPLARAVRRAVGSHVTRVVFDIPSHSLTARALGALQALIDSLR
jgi:CheY-like chemotaxis protein